MKKFVFMVTFLTICSITLLNKASDLHNIVYVDDDFDETVEGWNLTHFRTVQEAIDRVDENGTVFVYNGNYSENLTINKTLNLYGENRERTFINGKISVYGKAKIKNFYIKGIEIFSSSNIISNCNIFNGSGIYISNCNNNTVYRCIISNNNYGIYVNSSFNNNISKNNFINNTSNAFDNSKNLWNENYWSDFDEPSEGAYDNDSNGIVDSPYYISGGDNNDSFPSINAWDFILPSISYTIYGEEGKNGWYKSNVSIDIEANDNYEILQINYSINGVWNITNNSLFNITIGDEGIYNISIYALDKNENSIETEFTIKVDKTPPGISYIIDPPNPDGKNGWYRNVSISISAIDVVSGMNDGSIAYDINGEGWQEYKGFFSLREEGYLNISIRAIDSAGNEFIKSFDLKKDSTPPSIIINSPSGGLVKGYYEIIWNASDYIDNDLNGDISIFYSPDNETWLSVGEGIQNNGTHLWNTFIFNDSKNGIIKILAEDDAGNIGISSQNFTLDNTPPLVSITSPKEEAYGKDDYGNIIIEIRWEAYDAIDDDLNGNINISCYNGTWFDISTNCENSFRYTINAKDWDDGTYLIEISATDDAGNIEIAYSKNFKIDKQPPKLMIIKPSKGYLYINLFGKDIVPPIKLFGFLYDNILIGKTKIEIYVYDAHSGIQEVRIKIDENEPFPVESPYQSMLDLPTGIHKIKIIAKDNAKNVKEEEIGKILCLNF